MTQPSMRAVALLLCGLVLLAASGCKTTAGRDFARPAEGSLKLGATTQQEVQARYGEPQSTASGTYNNEVVTSDIYTFSSNTEPPLVGGVTPGRALSCHFLHGTLVGYEFTSSFRKDHTSFNPKKGEQLEVGVSRREDVVALVGPPNGEYQRPLVDAPHARALVYSYAQDAYEVGLFTFDSHHGRSRMVVLLDSDGVVRDVEVSDVQM